jgi:hypothetical protein
LKESSLLAPKAGKSYTNDTIVDKPIVFLLARHQPSFKGMFPVAHALKAEGIRPIFLLEREVDELNVEQCDKEGIEKICLWHQEDVSGVFSSKEVSTTNKKIFSISEHISWQKIIYKIAHFLPVPWAFFGALKEIRRQKRLARRLIEAFTPSVILLNGDRHTGLELPLIKEANNSGIPTLVLPLGYSAPEGSAKYREDAPIYWVYQGPFRWVNRFVKHLLPYQTYETDDGHAFLFYPAWWTLAAWLSGILPQKPWYMGGGHTSIVAIDGIETKQRYVSYGIDGKKLVITGQPAFDDLYGIYLNKKRIREELIQKWHLDPQRKLLICALPQMGEHEILPWDRHWQEINFLVETLSSQNASIVLSLHPKMDKEQYAYLRHEFHVTISEYPLSQILPIADVFVATFSSTVIWAILCQIPTIIVDFYDLNYNIWDTFEGCIIERNRTEFNETLHRVLNDDKFYSQLQQNQRKSSHLIAPFDGKAMERIINLVKENIRPVLNK